MGPKETILNYNTHSITHLEIIHQSIIITKKDDFDKFKGYQLPEITKELKTSGSWFK